MEGASLQTAVEFLDSWLGYRARQVDIPGFCVAILYKDSLVFSQSYGFADIGRHELISTDHLFGVGSQTKMFTATSILQLVERGQLQLDDLVCDYVPWLLEHPDKRFQEITIRQLLSHSAGLARDGLDSDFWELKRSFPTTVGLRKVVLRAGISLEPNTQLKYSNLGYALLGQVIKAVSGQAFGQYVITNIIKPLELTDTFVDFSPELADRMATAYGVPYEHQRQVLAPRLPTHALAPAVGIHTTTTDMCRFVAAHFFGNETILSDRFKKEAQRSQWVNLLGYSSGSQFGLGFEVQLFDGRRVLGHSGHLSGHCSATYFDPHGQLAVSIATNCKEAPVTAMAHGIFQALDWFATYANGSTPKQLARLNTRAHNATAAIEVIATKQRITVIDPDDWEPFGWAEELERVSANTLRVTTTGSLFNEGELIRYKFADNVVRAVRYAGFTMLPDPNYGQPVHTQKTPVGNELAIAFEDLMHAQLRIGRIVRITTERSSMPASYTLHADFGPKLGTVRAYLSALPASSTARQLRGRMILGAVYPCWYFGKQTNEILIFAMAEATETVTLPGTPLALVPDPNLPAVLPRNSARSITNDYIAKARSLFHLELMPDYIDAGGDQDTMAASLDAWKQGKYRKSMALAGMLHDTKPAWLTPIQTLSRRRGMQNIRLRITDPTPTPYQQWARQVVHRVNIPLYKETIYTLPRKYLEGLELPSGDIMMLDEASVLVNRLEHGIWVHSTLHEASHGHELTPFVDLKHNLLNLAAQHGERLTVG